MKTVVYFVKRVKVTESLKVCRQINRQINTHADGWMGRWVGPDRMTWNNWPLSSELGSGEIACLSSAQKYAAFNIIS